MQRPNAAAGLLGPLASIAGLTAAALLLSPATCAAPAQDPPPGMVKIEGGRTAVGSDKKDVEEIVKANPAAEDLIRAIDAETPKHMVDVPDFYLMRTEVTNEQYAEFVKATGHRPPYVWGEEAINAAAQAFLQDPANKGVKFDAPAWWDAHWPEATWAIAPGDLLRPVIFVDYQDALAYCRWAGLRLPTEAEFQRACRGKSESLYPWGDEWEDGEYCMSREYRKRNEIQPAGTFPKGVGPYGNHDLSGNVWEWTSSPYLEYPGYKANTYKLSRKENVKPVAKFDGDERVLVGGSYQNTKVAARCTTRRGSQRDQRTAGVGFRAASSLAPCVDKAQAIFDADVKNSAHRPSGTTLALPLSVGLEHWTARPTAAKLDSQPKGYAFPEGYGVIASHDHMLFIPVEVVEEGNDGTWRRNTVDGEPAVLGVLSLSEAPIAPALPKGVFFVKYRAKGKPKRTTKDKEKDKEGDGAGEIRGVGAAQDPAEPGALDQPWLEEIDVEKDLLLFFDVNTGALAGSYELPSEIAFDKIGTPGWSDAVEKVQVLDDKGKPKFEDQPRLRMHAEIPHRLRGKVVPVDIVFQFDAATQSKAWRGKL